MKPALTLQPSPYPYAKLAMRKPLHLAHTMPVIVKMNPAITFLSDINRLVISWHGVLICEIRNGVLYAGSSKVAMQALLPRLECSNVIHGKVTEWETAAPQDVILTACRHRALIQAAIGDATVTTCMHCTVLSSCLSKCTETFRKLYTTRTFICPQLQDRAV